MATSRSTARTTLSLNFISDTVLQPRTVPTPVGPQSPSNPGENDTLGRINQTVFTQTIITSADFYKGDTTFKPPEYEFKATLALNYNRVKVDQVRALQIDPRLGQTRDDGFLGVQELFYLKDLRTVDERFDFDEVRIGIQPFSTDFRGFLFQDSEPGIRFFGNRDNNRWQYNLAYFRRLEKDLNSGLNDVTKSPRHDDILLFNVYRQDLPWTGFTSQGIILYNHNRDNKIYDSDGFLERPAAIGLEQLRAYDVTYLGYNGDGHIDRVNLTVSAYAALGHQNHGVFVNTSQQIRAGFVAADVNGFDWARTPVRRVCQRRQEPVRRQGAGLDTIFENLIRWRRHQLLDQSGDPTDRRRRCRPHGGNSLILTRARPRNRASRIPRIPASPDWPARISISRRRIARPRTSTSCIRQHRCARALRAVFDPP